MIEWSFHAMFGINRSLYISRGITWYMLLIGEALLDTCYPISLRSMTTLDPRKKLRLDYQEVGGVSSPPQEVSQNTPRRSLRF
jgi:hypothetical protein